jgi:hypothetical protein
MGGTVTTPSIFDLAVNGLLGFVMNELGRGRMTAIQADLIKEHVGKMETAHKAVQRTLEEL